MKAAVYYNNNDIRIEELPKPKINDNEILVKTKACGICGSDVMEWYRAKKAPLVLGHEMTGEVVETGKNVKSYKKGDIVFSTHHVPCNKCKYCLNDKHIACDTLKKTNFHPGGFSEFIRIPKINIENGTFKLPKEIDFEDGTFIEPLGCVVRGQRIADIKKGDTVLVIGSGISGLLHIQLAKLKGAKVIATDIDEFRLKSAKKLGADFVINAKEDVPNKVKGLINQLADKVIVCTGALPAIKQALNSVEKSGTILWFAPTDPNTKVEIPFNELWMKGITLTTTYAAVEKDLKEAIELIKKRKINVKDMITHRLKLEEIKKGFKLVSEAKNSIKVIIEF